MVPSRLSAIGRVVGLGLGLAWGTWVGWGNERLAQAGDYAIQNWQLEQGLPQISVTSIAQTPDGYLWVGTFNGLARFDGVRFTVFTEGNAPALGSGAITHLQVDEQGALWILTLKGRLVRLAAGQFTTAWSQNAQTLLGGDASSNGSGHGVFLLDRNRGWHQLRNTQLLPLGDRFVTHDAPAFLFENSCLGWAVREGKITQIRQAPLSVSPGATGESNRVSLVLHSAGVSQAGGYWVAGSNGLFRLSGGQLSACVAPVPAMKSTHYTLQEDGQGTLWAGQWGAGLFRLNAEGTWCQFGAGSGLADGSVNCLFRDREGSLWVGTGQGGLYRIRPGVFRVYESESGPNVVMGVTQDRQGRMWFGVNGSGLNTLSEGKLKPVTKPGVLRNWPLAYSVLADRQDTVWIGLYGQTALQWRGDVVVTHAFGEGATEPMTVDVLFEDRSGTVWLGAGPVVFRYAQGRLTRYAPRDGLSTDPVSALAEDRSGTLYVGTDGGGLYFLRGGRFTCLTEQDGLADNHLTSLYVDAEDTLWIGTADRGLSRFRNGRFHTAGLKNGLPTLTLGRMLEDGLGNLWLGSSRGIIRVNRAALNDYLDGKRKSVTWDVFGRSDGLSTDGCAGASQPAVWRAKDGTLWFATIKGVAVVDPNRIPFNGLAPPVTIEEVALDDQAQATPFPELTVGPQTHRIEFRFTGLSLAAPEKVRFRYQLEPFDRDWIEVGTRRIAYYSGVRPGRYRFRVTACNNDGVWNEAGAALAVVVLPPWWRTWGFQGSVALSLASLVCVGFAGRARRLRRERLAQESFSRQLIASQEHERRRLAVELHDGLGQDLLVVVGQAQLSLAEPGIPPAAAARLNEIAQTARQALQQTRRVAHNLRPGVLQELGLSKAIRACADKLAQASGISMAVALDDVDDLLPAEFETNLFRIAQEILNNVVKHARASEVKVLLTRQPASLRLLVEDNGCGFESAPADQRGFGLRQIAERAKVMGGCLDLQSRPGHGTHVAVDVPLSNPGSHR